MKLSKKQILLGVVALLPLVLYPALGGWVARNIADIFGATLARINDGKFEDPLVFVRGRMKEALVIFYSLLAVVIVVISLGHLWRNRSYAGLLNGIAVFLGVNFLAWIGGNSVLICSLFYDEINVDNFIQYQIKRKLLTETSDKPRVILIGNSQTNRNIEERLLNEELGDRIWTTELTQPGTRGFDMLVLARDIPLRRGDFVMTYFSEIVCYGGSSGTVVPRFLHFGDLNDLVELDGMGRLYSGALKNGIVARIFPLFRYQESISKKILGPDITNIGQFRFDTSRKPDIDEMAGQIAASFSTGAGADFEKNSVIRMAEDMRNKGCTLIIIKGDLNPALVRLLSPEVKKDMRQFYTLIEQKFPDTVITVDGSDFLAPTEDTFTDIVHSTDEAQIEFTKELAKFLNKTVAEKK